jgi:hypothetical protein
MGKAGRLGCLLGDYSGLGVGSRLVQSGSLAEFLDHALRLGHTGGTLACVAQFAAAQCVASPQVH